MTNLLASYMSTDDPNRALLHAACTLATARTSGGDWPRARAWPVMDAVSCSQAAGGVVASDVSSTQHAQHLFSKLLTCLRTKDIATCTTRAMQKRQR